MNSTGSALATDLQITENIMLNAPAAFRDDLAAEASLTYQTSITNYGVDISSYDHYLTAINRWNWYPSNTLTLRSGIDWRFLYINTSSVAETKPVKTGNQGGVYITGEWKPLKPLMLIASVKGSTDTREAVAVPKIGLRWELLDNFTLKNNYFRSFKFPDFDDLYYRSLDSVFVGNPNLKPEDGWGADLTGELTLGDSFTLESAVYGQYTEDSIHWVKSAGGRWSPENVGAAWFAGFDTRPKFVFKVNKRGISTIKIGASYQLQYSWLLSGDIGFEDSFRIPYMPTHIIGGSFDLAWKSGSLLVSAHYESTRYADTLNEMALDPYCVVNVTVNQNAGKYTTFFASARNLLNAHYESFASYHMPGISFTFGLRTTWSPRPKIPAQAAPGSERYD
jgi:vitamin B12 transporter